MYIIQHILLYVKLLWGKIVVLLPRKLRVYCTFGYLDLHHMKKLLSLFALAVFLFSPILAMTNENQVIADAILANILHTTNNGKDTSWLVEWYYIIDDNLENNVTDVNVADRLTFVKNELRTRIDNTKNTSIATKIISEQSFLTNYASGIVSSGDILHSKCYDYYDMFDDVAWSENVPTSLVIATWKMEAGCGFYYPNNGDGPFQMLYKNHTGVMTTSKMVNEIQDFARFSRNKWDWYRRSNGTGATPIMLTYTGWNLTGVVYQGALYNGLSGASIRGDIQPANPHYVWGRYGNAFSGSSKDGLLVNILKVIRDK